MEYKRRLHRKLMTLLSKAGFDDDMRHEFVYHWTNGRTSSTRELSEFELVQMIERIEKDPLFSHNINRQLSDEIRRKRSVVLSIATRTGIHDPNDWEKFNGFMLNRSVYHKPLNEYTSRELDDLIRQFRSIEYKYKKKKEREKKSLPKNLYSLN